MARNRVISRENKKKHKKEQNTNYYLHIGTKQFISTHTSAVEAIVLMREALEDN